MISKRVLSHCFNYSLILISGAVCLCVSGASLAQSELHQQRWVALESENFEVVSQLSPRATRNATEEFEQWRRFAASLITGADSFPRDTVPNLVFFFDDEDDFATIAPHSNNAFFLATPRANFIGLLPGNEESERLARHFYSHFLIRNYSTSAFPRWYEEGLASYSGRFEMKGNAAEFMRYSRQGNENLAQINQEFDMGRLLFNESALASHRTVLVANLKAESLFYYLQHGSEDDGVEDRRPQIATYLQLLNDGRQHRFAFDRAFNTSTRELDREFEQYLRDSRRPRVELSRPQYTLPELEVSLLETPAAALQLAELALNSGQLEVAQSLFRAAAEVSVPPARTLTGLGDSIRFNSDDYDDQEVASYYDRALEAEPDALNILLDYGEYWESELADCDKNYPQARRASIAQRIVEVFTRAVELAPNNAEARLAMGQLYLLDGQASEYGIPHQRRAFELLPSDSFIQEQTVKYAIIDEDYERAETLIAEMGQLFHEVGEAEWVTDLRERLLAKKEGVAYDQCAP